MTDTYSSVAASLIALAFGLSTFERYLEDRSRYELAWSVALALFAVAAGALALGSSAGFSGADFRVFYLFGAILNVPVLALGTIYLLLPERTATYSAACVGLFCAYAAGVLGTTPLLHHISGRILPEGSHVFSSQAQVLAGLGSGAGSIVIVLGAIVSVVRFRKSRIAAANVLIALGTLISGASGVLNSVFDKMTAFAVALAIGIAVIFVGFLVAPRGTRQERAKAAVSPLP